MYINLNLLLPLQAEKKLSLVRLREIAFERMLPNNQHQNNDNDVEEEQQRALELAQQVLGKCNHPSITYYS